MKAQSIAPQAQEWLLETTEARVMYCSDKVCNLINSLESVISITTPHVDLGPFSVMIPPVNLSFHTDSDANVNLLANGLQVGTLEIDTSFAQLWDPLPPWDSLRGRNKLIHDNLQIVLATLVQYAPSESLAGLVVQLPGARSSLEKKELALAIEPAYQLIRGIRTDDVELCVQGASRLAGLGFGYTPDGDDWILGSLLATWISKSHQEAKRLAEAVAKAAIPLTTPISAAWLRAASRGECAEPWHLFFDCLSKGSDTKIQEVSRKLISLGHSSGASAVAGFVASINGKM